MNNFRLFNSSDLDESKLLRFFEKSFGKGKAEFLAKNRSWWHFNSDNSLGVLKGGEIVAYCALIPTKCTVKENRFPAAWWVDLIVDPAYRGQGLQTLLDREIKERNELVLGVPNELAAPIHRKHGWGVRQDGKILLLPLIPSQVQRIVDSGSIKDKLLRGGLRVLDPLARIAKFRILHFHPRFSNSVKLENAELPAEVFEKYKQENVITTNRDVAFLEWRYLDAPYRSELRFYIAGRNGSLSHYLISRSLNRRGSKITRILDIFGDFRDRDTLRDIIQLSVKDAILDGSSQVTSMAWNQELISVLRSIGFVLSVKTAFCWYSKSQDIMELIRNSKCYWTYGDSDNDGPG